MKYLQKLVVGCLILAPLNLLAQNPFGINEKDTNQTRDIYGYDSRREAKLYDYDGYTSAVMTSMKASEFNGSSAYGWTLEEYLKKSFKVDKVDATVRFRNQPAMGGCTGFLIAPDIMVTAGHCISSDQHEITDGKVVFHKSYFNKYGDFTYNQKKWVFDYTNDISMTKKSLKSGEEYYVATIPTSNQYTVKRVLKSVLDNKRNLDYAVIQLDRPTSRDPFRFRTGAKIAKGDNLAMIGSPSGLPLKLSDGAKVTINSGDTWFGTNLDAFGGNSGGPVYNKAGQNLIEGILVRGRIDKGLKGFYVDESCGCVKEVKYENNESESILDDFGIPVSQMSTEVQRITSIPLSVKALAVYNNFKYAIDNNNKDRFDKWTIYTWAFTNDTTGWFRDAVSGEPIGVMAIKKGRTEMFKSLVDLGMHVDLDLGGGKTMLYHAIEQRNLAAVKHILKQGYDLELKDEYNNTAIHWALKYGTTEIINEVIRNGANVNAKNRWGETPLHVAVAKWNMEAVRLLIQNGADPSTPDGSGKTPRKKAKGIKFKDAARYLKKAEKGKL
ncbi:MAG: ankyrin repeat domain-containing protein [Bacteroidia bacterium]|nr:ankyrin repeat domain-containing protein [Bacteroidia bacterium]